MLPIGSITNGYAPSTRGVFRSRSGRSGAIEMEVTPTGTGRTLRLASGMSFTQYTYSQRGDLIRRTGHRLSARGRRSCGSGSGMINLLNKSIAYVVLRVAGFSLLAMYLLLWLDFSFSWIGALAYVLISFGVSYLMAALRIAERYPPLNRYNFVADKDLQQSTSRDDWASKQAAYLESGLGGSRILLTPTEDALVCVPVLLLGINPLTALLGGALFGLLHLGRFTYLECIGKAVIYSLVCYFVLPYGLLTVVVGHFANDAVSLLILKLVRRALERRKMEQSP